MPTNKPATDRLQMANPPTQTPPKPNTPLTKAHLDQVIRPIRRSFPLSFPSTNLLTLMQAIQTLKTTTAHLNNQITRLCTYMDANPYDGREALGDRAELLKHISFYQAEIQEIFEASKIIRVLEKEEVEREKREGMGKRL